MRGEFSQLADTTLSDFGKGADVAMDGKNIGVVQTACCLAYLSAAPPFHGSLPLLHF